MQTIRNIRKFRKNISASLFRLCYCRFVTSTPIIFRPLPISDVADRFFMFMRSDTHLLFNVTEQYQNDRCCRAHNLMARMLLLECICV